MSLIKSGTLPAENWSISQLPLWLESSAKSIKKTSEWSSLTKEMHRVVRQNLDVNNVHAFVDLSPSERALFIDKAEEVLKNDGTYKGFLSKLSENVDECLTSEVIRTMRLPGNTKTKTEVLVEKSEEGLLTLLRSFPEDHDTLKLLLNQHIPDTLRKEIWAKNLNNPKARRLFDEQVSVSLLKTISKQDVEITRNCERLVDQHFPFIADDVHSVTMMKTVLSYIDTLHTSPPQWVYFAIVPIVDVFAKNSMIYRKRIFRDPQKVPNLDVHDSTWGESNMSDASTVVEMFVGLLSLPKPLLANEGEINEYRGGGAFECILIESLLLKHSHELHAHIIQVFAEDGNLSTHPVSDLFMRPVQRLMVGFYSHDVVMYIWDQCMLTSFVDMLPKFAVATLLILKEALLQVDTPQMLFRVLSQHSKSTITIRRLQITMSRKFMKKIREHLGLANANSSLWTSVGGVDGMEYSLFSLHPDNKFEALRGKLGDQQFEEQMAKMDLEAARKEIADDRAKKKEFLEMKKKEREEKLKEIQKRNDQKRRKLKLVVAARHLKMTSAAEQKRKAQWCAIKVQKLVRKFLEKRRTLALVEKAQAEDNALIIQCAIRASIAKNRCNTIKDKKAEDLRLFDIVQASAATRLQSGYRRLLGLRRAILHKYQLENNDVVSVLFPSGPLHVKLLVGDGMKATGCQIEIPNENEFKSNLINGVESGMWIVMVDGDDIPELSFKAINFLFKIKTSKKKKLMLSRKRPEKRLSEKEKEKDDREREEYKKLMKTLRPNQLNKIAAGSSETIDVLKEEEATSKATQQAKIQKKMEEQEALEAAKEKAMRDSEEAEKNKYMLDEPRHWKPPEKDGTSDIRVVVPGGSLGLMLRPSITAGDAPVVISFGKGANLKLEKAVTPGMVLTALVDFGESAPTKEEESGEGKCAYSTFDMSYEETLEKVEELKNNYKALYFRNGEDFLRQLKEMVVPDIRVPEDANILEQAFLKSVLAIRWMAMGDNKCNKAITDKVKANKQILDKEAQTARIKCLGNKFADGKKFEKEDKKMRKAGGKKLKKWEANLQKTIAKQLKFEAVRLSKTASAAKKVASKAKAQQIKAAKKNK